MILTQDKLKDVIAALAYVDLDLSIIKTQFKLLSEFENYNLPNIEPVVLGIEVEIHSNLRMEFTKMMNGETKLWSRQQLVRDSVGILNLKVWNTTPTLLPFRELSILEIEEI